MYTKAKQVLRYTNLLLIPSSATGHFESIMTSFRTINKNRFWQQCQRTVDVRMNHERIETDSPPQAGGLVA